MLNLCVGGWQLHKVCVACLRSSCCISRLSPDLHSDQQRGAVVSSFGICRINHAVGSCRCCSCAADNKINTIACLPVRGGSPLPATNQSTSCLHFTRRRKHRNTGLKAALARCPSSLVHNSAKSSISTGRSTRVHRRRPARLAHPHYKHRWDLRRRRPHPTPAPRTLRPLVPTPLLQNKSQPQHSGVERRHRNMMKQHESANRCNTQLMLPSSCSKPLCSSWSASPRPCTSALQYTPCSCNTSSHVGGGRGSHESRECESSECALASGAAVRLRTVMYP
jgi:hypothetical protein